jgi:TetR/AcrR family transcriptional regulator
MIAEKTASKPKRANHVRKKRISEIFDAAEQEFATAGYEGTSLHAIAERAGLTKWQVLYFFKSKENLYRKTIDRIFSEWRSQELGDWKGKPKEIIGEYIDHILQLAQAKPHQSKIIVSEMLRGGTIAIPLLKERNADAAMERTTERLARWISDGEMKAGSPLHFILMLWSMQHFYVVFEREVAFFLGKAELDQRDWNRIRENVKAAALLHFQESH